VGFDVVEPDDPVEPECPDTASGKDTAVDAALPVRPLLVALDWARTSPELPDPATGLPVTDAVPPDPPSDEPVATLVPPTTDPAAPPRATPPGPTLTTGNPPSPPTPANASVPTRLMASPVEPESAKEVAPAPEFAELTASPMEVARPVSPEEPELPDRTVPPKAMADPRIAVLVAEGLDVAGPVGPVVPEWPDTASGLDTADENAEPVLPLLVALDCAVECPE